MSACRLYLKNLPSDATRDDVFNYLERFGRLTELKIIESESFSYGFAQFSSNQAAKTVLDTFRNRLFLGHRTVIEPARPPARPLRTDIPPTESRSSNSYSRSPHHVQAKYYPNRAHQCRYPVLVDNIPRHICWQELKDFGRLAGGLVAYCDLDRNRNGRGFIEYLSRADAEEAIRLLNGQTLGGQAVRVSVHSSASRRSSRSRSPIRRPYSPIRRSRSPMRYEAPAVPLRSSDEARGRMVPTSSARHSPQKSAERLSSQSFTSSSYSDETSPPAVRSDLSLHTFSKAIDYYRSGRLLGETGTAIMLEPTSYLDCSKHPANESHDYHEFDRYLQLSYERRLECLPGCY
ncbi:hypothetical protein B0H11DRAFT_137205 [Mycena galericulata]|nr:hypothetical protein B0H11DRAFT_137205 [Mycena galericulata]